ncbi:MAG: JAB domain-containing protein [Flavobacteriales bacterium]|jgi:DNA repair protein RadC
MINKLKQIHVYEDIIGELTVTYRRTKALNKQIKSSNDIDKFIRPYFDEYLDNHEEFMIIHLNRANYVRDVQYLSKGSSTASIVHIKFIMQNAILLDSYGIVLVHNHPGGSLKPSKQDIAVTNKIKDAAAFFDITVLDHIILTRESFFSFFDESIL